MELALTIGPVAYDEFIAHVDHDVLNETTRGVTVLMSRAQWRGRAQQLATFLEVAEYAPAGDKIAARAALRKIRLALRATESSP